MNLGWSIALIGPFRVGGTIASVSLAMIGVPFAIVGLVLDLRNIAFFGLICLIVAVGLVVLGAILYGFLVGGWILVGYVRYLSVKPKRVRQPRRPRVKAQVRVVPRSQIPGVTR